MKTYLKSKHRIIGRWTTINGAFQHAIDVPELYDENKARTALELLGQDPDADLTCVYCGDPAKTWDHLNNNVMDGWFSGYGSRIYNLVPACRRCNESKTQKPWKKYLEYLNRDDRETRESVLSRFAEKTEAARFGWSEIKAEFPDLAKDYAALRTELRSLLEKADGIAEQIRGKIHERRGTKATPSRRSRKKPGTY
jgi:hypothetical protein